MASGRAFCRNRADARSKARQRALVQIICPPIFGPSDELKAGQWPGS
jgi:hypothetical protein